MRPYKLLTVDYSVRGYFFSFIYLQLNGCMLWMSDGYAPHGTISPTNRTHLNPINKDISHSLSHLNSYLPGL